jgi:hypothetical protein
MGDAAQSAFHYPLEKQSALPTVEYAPYLTEMIKLKRQQSFTPQASHSEKWKSCALFSASPASIKVLRGPNRLFTEGVESKKTSYANTNFPLWSQMGNN